MHSYQLRDVATGGPANPASSTVFPQLIRTDKRFYEGRPAAGVSTSVEMSYDEYGNVVRSFDTADVGADDDVESRFGYSASDPACRDRHIVCSARLRCTIQ